MTARKTTSSKAQSKTDKIVSLQEKLIDKLLDDSLDPATMEKVMELFPKLSPKIVDKIFNLIHLISHSNHSSTDHFITLEFLDTLILKLSKYHDEKYIDNLEEESYN